MKSNRLIVTIGAAWVLFIALDSFSGILRAWYLRKMSNPFRSFYQYKFKLWPFHSILISGLTIKDALGSEGNGKKSNISR